jgi:hypothetical protein
MEATLFSFCEDIEGAAGNADSARTSLWATGFCACAAAGATAAFGGVAAIEVVAALGKEPAPENIAGAGRFDADVSLPATGVAWSFS